MGTQTRRQQQLYVKRCRYEQMARIVLIAVIAVFSLLYLLQTNDVSTRGFEMSALEQEIETLERENRRLNVEIAQYRSMDSIQSRLSGKEFVDARNVQYVTPIGTAVAKR